MGQLCAIIRGAVVAAVSLAAALPATRAAAATSADACLASYDRYQKLADAGKLLEARHELGVCGSESCPATLQRECVTQLAPLEARIPTVVLVARDSSKRDLLDVSVALDGRPYKDRLDGREGAIDPGPHTLRFTDAAGKSLELKVVVNEREKGRFLEAEFPASDAAPPSPAPPAEAGRAPSAPRADGRVSPLVWVLGGVGVVALGTSAFFGVSGLSARSEANACRPLCTTQQIDDVNHRFLAADVALGVAVVSFAAAVVLYATHAGGARAATGATTAQSR